VEADPLGVIDTDEGPVGQALRQLRALGLEGVGPAALDPLPGAETVERGLAGDDGFAARPTLDGAPREVGPLAGRREHPAVAAVVDEFGPGILARMVARLVDVRARLAEAEAALSRLEPLAAAADGLAGATGVATGAALTARGPLFHRVALDRGRVRSWTSVAPTEWNLHPGGALRSLEGQPAARAEAAGRWLLAALDPCVPAEVRVEPA
jgi:coenzyme F420-reducing hydrogenase alpha subunit